MARTDSALALKKYLARTSAAGQDWADGIANTTKDIAANAVKAAPKYKANMMASLQNDTWAKRMSRVTTADIKAAVVAAGAGAYTGGISRRSSKIEKAFARVMPLIKANADKIQAMADITPADREARMLANLRGMRAIKTA